MLEEAVQNLKSVLESYDEADEIMKPAWKYRIAFSRGMLVGIACSQFANDKITWEQYEGAKQLLEETL